MPSGFAVLGAVLGALAGPLLGCLPLDPFACTTHEQCDESSLGVCQPNGYCSYPDLACEGGLRYEPHAGDGLGGDCVEAPTGSSTDDGIAGTETSGTSEGSTGEASTDDGGSSTTGEPTCGGPGDPCCAADTCDAGLACQGSGCGCVARLVPGRRHTCAIELDGSLWCWGANEVGQLGVSVEPFESTPVQVSEGFATAVVEASARNHTCARGEDDTLRCWGSNGSGESVPASVELVVGPTVIEGLATPVTVTAGNRHTCIANSGGTVTACWGDNTSGQLTGETAGPGPILYTGSLSFVELVSGDAHTCGRTDTGAIYCWGDNTYGQLAADPATFPSANLPRSVTIASPVQLAASDQSTCVRTTDQVFCWGRNDVGQLGDGSGVQQFTPVPVALPEGVAPEALAMGPQHGCVLSAGVAHCWGSNGGGQLRLVPDQNGNDAYTLLPVPLDTGGVTLLQLVGGGQHGCALADTGNVLCWGTNTEGQIGDGTTNYAFEPTVVELPCP